MDLSISEAFTSFNAVLGTLLYGVFSRKMSYFRFKTTFDFVIILNVLSVSYGYIIELYQTIEIK